MDPSSSRPSVVARDVGLFYKKKKKKSPYTCQYVFALKVEDVAEAKWKLWSSREGREERGSGEGNGWMRKENGKEGDDIDDMPCYSIPGEPSGGLR